MESNPTTLATTNLENLISAIIVYQSPSLDASSETNTGLESVTGSPYSSPMETINGTSSVNPLGQGQRQENDVEYESEDEAYGFTQETDRQHSSSGSRHVGFPSDNEGAWSQSRGQQSVLMGKISHGPHMQSTLFHGAQTSVSKKDLAQLGNFQSLDRNRNECQMIMKYIENSHRLGPKGGVKVHNILANTSIDFRNKASSSKKPGVFPKFQLKQANSDYKMMLWCKTSPESIRRFAQRQNTCLAFYDRVTRAFSVEPNSLRQNYRQTILLCSVYLGNVKKSPEGYQKWKKVPLPRGFDSVKGTGKFSPNWRNNKTYEGIIVPCGETQRDLRFPSYQIDYNEYMIYYSKQVRVLFAVDLEICV